MKTKMLVFITIAYLMFSIVIFKDILYDTPGIIGWTLMIISIVINCILIVLMIMLLKKEWRKKNGKNKSI